MPLHARILFRMNDSAGFCVRNACFYCERALVSGHFNYTKVYGAGLSALKIIADDITRAGRVEFNNRGSSYNICARGCRAEDRQIKQGIIIRDEILSVVVIDSSEIKVKRGREKCVRHPSRYSQDSAMAAQKRDTRFPRAGFFRHSRARACGTGIGSHATLLELRPSVESIVCTRARGARAFTQLFYTSVTCTYIIYVCVCVYAVLFS